MDILIFLYLILFPFGKLLGNATDLIVILICLTAFLRGQRFKLNNFVLVCVFSLLFSLSFFKLPQIFIGVLYLVRFISYVLLSQIVQKQFGRKQKTRELIFNSLMTAGIFIAIFGWIQYFIFPDVRFLKQFGWDDHYFRLVSTYLDPAFTGILLVLTEILVLVRTIKIKTFINYFLNIFLILTILFTYSRASYLALFFALIFLTIKFREKFLLFMLALFLILIPVLPKASSEGTNLVRTYSVGQKFINFNESFGLIKKSPVFGIGFDNICAAKNRFLNADNPSSHTCSGLDNSILFIIATTGIVGLVAFLDSMLHIVKNTRFNIYGTALIASFLAVFIHGMFTETFFYSFVMGWIAILIGVTRD